jgi:hypothetical protein
MDEGISCKTRILEVDDPSDGLQRHIHGARGVMHPHSGLSDVIGMEFIDLEVIDRGEIRLTQFQGV